jgi:2-oxoisovalerate dehydrogenase E2 component (dihydrolipoyl transacylase)
MTTFNLPDLGEGLTEAELVAWHVSPGDHVVRDAPLASVETDKAIVEVPAPYSGTIEKLRAAPGALIAVGAPLIDIDTGAHAEAPGIVGELKETESGPPPPAATHAPKAEALKALPAARRLARELGVDLGSVKGSGPEGAILAADVRAAATHGGEHLRGVRRAMAEAMTVSAAAVVPATLTDCADVSAWMVGGDPSVRLIRAVVAGCMAEPALNAGFDGQRRWMNHSVDLSLAIEAPDGLFAPVLRGVDAATPAELRQRLNALKAAVRDRTLAPENLKGGTVTLSNFGMLAGIHAALVVSPPQVAILGVGRIEDAVVAVGGAPTIRTFAPLSLTFDHRVVTGGEAARFMKAARADLEIAN